MQESRVCSGDCEEFHFMGIFLVFLTLSDKFGGFFVPRLFCDDTCIQLICKQLEYITVGDILWVLCCYAESRLNGVINPVVYIKHRHTALLLSRVDTVLVSKAI